MKRGGQIIYNGPLGQQSQNLIAHFEVSTISTLQNLYILKIDNLVNYLQAFPEVPRIKDGYNPATWVLEISTPAVESQLRVDFAEFYTKSELYQLSID